MMNRDSRYTYFKITGNFHLKPAWEHLELFYIPNKCNQ